MKERWIALLVFFATLSFGSTRPSAQEWARRRLETSPRHQEWVTITYGQRTVHAFVVYPEAKTKTPAVIVIHENRGLTDWVRSVADQLAEAGVIAIAPDLLSGMAPNGGRTSDFPSEDAAREAISKLPPEQVMADLDAIADYAARLPASNGKVAVAGFCWGGSQAFRFATHRQNLAAAFVFYGTGPRDSESLARIRCPVYGFYGGNDARVTATVPETADVMKRLGKTFEPITYDGAGHGFMRTGEEPNPTDANRKAREQAWARWKELLKKL
ncbi:MAG: dienelactone hydrolase family protein [Acidobacteriota bacterium]|nr:dienelactone hydrolase family protein [Acidobacteriota bacterium]MDW8255454.1 dienelactone hydrolase family protein [Acidobacteriota bacterium]